MRRLQLSRRIKEFREKKVDSLQRSLSLGKIESEKTIKTHTLAEAEDILISKPPLDLFSSDSDSAYEFFTQSYKEYVKNEKLVDIMIHPVSEEDSGSVREVSHKMKFFIQ